MAKTWTVSIEWTDWLELDDELWLERDAVYMFATEHKSLYIGRAGDSTVRQRFCSHDKSGKLIEIDDYAGDENWGLWVGEVSKEEGIRSIELLEDIETLLIFCESLRDNCDANKQNTETRGKYHRPGMIIVNHGNFKPLLHQYRDSEEFFDEIQSGQ